MKNAKSFFLTREKHLDHMVKVVPFIVLCYAVQCFIILKLSPTEFSSLSLSFLGGFLAMMITSFITYDLKHRVFFEDDHLTLSFFGTEKTISYKEIIEIEVKDPKETFSTLTLKTVQGKHTFYFVDNASAIKAWIENQKNPEQKLAA